MKASRNYENGQITFAMTALLEKYIVMNTGRFPVVLNREQ